MNKKVRGDILKILFSDMDGTLIDKNLSISDKNIEMMKELKRQGHCIALCTGRNLFETRQITDHIDFPFDYLVLNNGGHILNRNYETLFEKKIDKKIGIDILKHTTSYLGMWSFYCDGHVNYGYKDGITINHGDIEKHPIDIDFHKAFLNADYFQIIAFNQDDEGIENAKKCYDYIQEHYGEYVEAYFNTHYVDVVPSGCSKGNGVVELLKHIDEPIEAVYAVGDSYNDLSMIIEADFGYTFCHAHDDIKKETKNHVHYVYEVIADMLGGK